MASTIRIVFFGTGGSWPSPERNVMSIGVQVDGEILLFDCGEGTQRQMMKTSMSFMKVKKIFITHYHGDHFLGLAGLIQTMVLNDRKDELEIYGPVGTIDIVTKFLSLGYYSLSFPIKIYEIEPPWRRDFGDYEICGIDANHPVPSLSYCLKEKDMPKIDKKKADALGLSSKIIEDIRNRGEINYNGKTIKIVDIMSGLRRGRKIVYSGDTAPYEKIVEFAKDADVLIHEATVDSSLEEKANRYGHSSARQAAEIAKKANVRFLFLVHISSRYKNPEPLEKEARAIFSHTKVPKDLEEFIVKVRKNQ